MCGEVACHHFMIVLYCAGRALAIASVHSRRVTKLVINNYNVAYHSWCITIIKHNIHTHAKKIIYSYSDMFRLVIDHSSSLHVKIKQKNFYCQSKKNSSVY
jgi:hypothetical protein